MPANAGKKNGHNPMPRNRIINPPYTGIVVIGYVAYKPINIGSVNWTGLTEEELRREIGLAFEQRLNSQHASPSYRPVTVSEISVTPIDSWNGNGSRILRVIPDRRPRDG